MPRRAPQINMEILLIKFVHQTVLEMEVPSYLQIQILMWRCVYTYAQMDFIDKIWLAIELVLVNV